MHVHILFPPIRQIEAKTNVAPAIVKIPIEMQGHQPQNKHDLDAESDRDNGTKDIESYDLCALASFDHDMLLGSMRTKLTWDFRLCPLFFFLISSLCFIFLRGA